MALYCGLREGEVLGIHFEDVDLLHRTINVRHAVRYIIRKGIIIKEPKSEAGKRPVVIPGVAFSVLSEYMFNSKRKDGLIFITGNGTPISPRNLIRHFDEMNEKLGLPDIRFHDLRHTPTPRFLFSLAYTPKSFRKG